MRRTDDGGAWPPELPTEPPEAFIVELDITSPGSGTLTGPAQGLRLLVSGAARTISGSGVLDRVEVQVGDAPFLPATSLAPGWTSWQCAVDLTADGVFQVTARALDSRGQAIAQRSVTVTVDLAPAPGGNPPAGEPPVAASIAITAPSDGATVTLGEDGKAQLEVLGRVMTAGDESVELLVDAQPVPAQRSGETFSATVEIAGNGSHLIEARVHDAFHQASARAALTAAELPPAPPEVERLMLVEKYQLSTFQGEYGYGPTIKMVSLLPGEKTTVTVKSWRRLTDTTTSADSILESGETHVTDSFESSLSNEQDSKSVEESKTEWHADVEGSVDFGGIKASVDTGAAGSVSASRELTAKRVESALRKHAGEASSKRQIELKTSNEMKREEGEEFSSETHIENINLSRTLNYVFRQMNQEYLTIMHLVGVGVVHLRGDRVPDPADPAKTRLEWSSREVSLAQLDPLLRSVIVPARVADVRRMVLDALGNVFDHQDERHRLYEQVDLRDEEGRPVGSYLRFPKGKVSTYTDPATGTAITVPGVIVSVMRNIMRTDGVACDAVLGDGKALDEYNTGLQDAAVEARRQENARAAAAARKDRLAVEIVRDNDADRARVFGTVFPERPAEGLALTTVAADAAANGRPA